MNSKVLLVYFSNTGKTRLTANLIERITGCDIDVITPVSPYPQDPYSVRKKISLDGPNYRPKIRELTHDVKEYGTVIIGSPVWNTGLPPPVLTFLEQNDWRGVKIHPFFSCGGTYIKAYSLLMKKCKGANVTDPLFMIYDLNGNFLRMVE